MIETKNINFYYGSFHALKDISMKNLREKYDAVLIAIGASTDKKLGFEGVQFHDDDAVPDMNELTPQQIFKKAGEVKKQQTITLL